MRVINTGAYSTQDELYFIRGLFKDKKTKVLRNYVKVIRKRRWDAGIDVDEIEAVAKTCLSLLEEVPFVN